MGGQNIKAYTKKIESILENIISQSSKGLQKSAIFEEMLNYILFVFYLSTLLCLMITKNNSVPLYIGRYSA